MIEGTIDCQEARSRFSGYLSGTESGEAAIELEAHLDECIDCRLAFEHRRESQAAMAHRERSAVDFERISQEAEALQSRSIASALRKQSLQQLLQSPIEPPASLEPFAAEAEVVEQVLEPAIALASPDPTSSTTMRVRRPWKSVAYASALMSVLAAAILVSANSGAIFESPAPVREPGRVEEVAQMPQPLPTDATPEVPEPVLPNPTEELATTSLVGETVGSNTGLTIVTAKPEVAEVATPAKSIRRVGRNNKSSVRKRTLRRRIVRRSPAPQGVRVYNP